MDPEKPPLPGDPRRESFRIYEGETVKTKRAAELIGSAFARTLEIAGIRLPEDAKFLELGSGNNLVSDYFRKQGKDMVGVDARARHEASGSTVAARLEALPFADETFDAALSVGVFAPAIYDQNEEAILKEIERVLKKGGVYFAHGEDISSRKSALEKIYSGTFSLYQKK